MNDTVQTLQDNLRTFESEFRTIQLSFHQKEQQLRTFYERRFGQKERQALERWTKVRQDGMDVVLDQRFWKQDNEKFPQPPAMIKQKCSAPDDVLMGIIESHVDHEDIKALYQAISLWKNIYVNKLEELQALEFQKKMQQLQQQWAVGLHELSKTSKRQCLQMLHSIKKEGSSAELHPQNQHQHQQYQSDIHHLIQEIKSRQEELQSKSSETTTRTEEEIGFLHYLENRIRQFQLHWIMERKHQWTHFYEKMQQEYLGYDQSAIETLIK